MFASLSASLRSLLSRSSFVVHYGSTVRQHYSTQQQLKEQCSVHYCCLTATGERGGEERADLLSLLSLQHNPEREAWRTSTRLTFSAARVMWPGTLRGFFSATLAGTQREMTRFGARNNWVGTSLCTGGKLFACRTAVHRTRPNSTHVYMRTCMYMHICVQICVHVCMYVHMYAHVFTDTFMSHVCSTFCVHVHCTVHVCI